MASINNLYGSSINKGFGGLMSGLDTDDLVKQMTAATRNKINRQYQSKQKLLYRQEAYREVSKKLVAFSDKYFSFAAGSKTNILSSSFFEANTYKSSSDYVNVTGNADVISNFKINSISQVATATTASATINESISISANDMSKQIKDIVGLGGLTSYEITVNDNIITLNENMSINDIMKKINNESNVNITYSSTLNKFILSSKETGLESKINISGELLDTLFGTVVNKPGQNTVMEVSIYDEVVNIERSTTNFTIDGMNIELNKNAQGLNNISFDVTNNSDEIVEKVKKFIDEYNEIITLIGTKTKEKPNSKYLPLTPDQQEEMEEKEIENWDKEAKKGSLFGDSKMTTLLTNLRASMTGKTDVSDLVLSNIGISSASMDTSGKLVLDEKKFKESLMQNPDEIANLFTGKTSSEGAKSGLTVQIREILTKNIGAFGTSGILIEEAGLETGRMSDQNNISLKMKDYDDKMETLKRALEAERQRYWNQFTALEKTLSNLNAQSSWLTDMMG